MRQKGPPAADALAEGLELRDVRDLLHHYPRRYIDRSQVAPIGDLKVDQQATVIAKVKRVDKRQTRNRRSMVTVRLYDGTGYLDLTFFNQPWIANMYREGTELAVSGTIAMYRGHLQVQNQEVEILRGSEETVHTGRITPVHPATEGVTSRTIRELVFRALEQLAPIPDPLPAQIVSAESLSSYDEAIRTIHFPETQEQLDRARERLKFDELFTLELGVAFRKARIDAAAIGVAHAADGPRVQAFHASLPYEPTGAQIRAFGEVTEAMHAARPMHLLLQGDVGSGKTVVALHAALVAVDSGHQAAVMAPTEVLAGQHFRSMTDLLGRMGARAFLDDETGKPTPQASLFGGELAAEPEAEPGTRVEPALTTGVGESPALTFALLTASVTGKDRARVLEGIAQGDVDLVVGTHALVQEGVAFEDLSLAVVDEQHRFGVHQRMALKGKGGEPDVLVMTADADPADPGAHLLRRSRRLRPGRDAQRAWRDRDAHRSHRRGTSAGLRARSRAGGSRTPGVRGVRRDRRGEQERGSRGRGRGEEARDRGLPRPSGRRAPRADAPRREGAADGGVSLGAFARAHLHDRDRGRRRRAQRHGDAGRERRTIRLAQLHQLRGRIGRGEHRSFCILFDESKDDQDVARERLAAMVRTTDGFELADEDLRLRGEGTLFDVRQSGMPDLKLARLAEDLDLVKRARARAFAVIEADRELAEYPSLLAELRSRFERSIDWLFRS